MGTPSVAFPVSRLARLHEGMKISKVWSLFLNCFPYLQSAYFVRVFTEVSFYLHSSKLALLIQSCNMNHWGPLGQLFRLCLLRSKLLQENFLYLSFSLTFLQFLYSLARRPWQARLEPHFACWTTLTSDLPLREGPYSKMPRGLLYCRLRI